MRSFKFGNDPPETVIVGGKKYYYSNNNPRSPIIPTKGMAERIAREISVWGAFSARVVPFWLMGLKGGKKEKIWLVYDRERTHKGKRL